MAKFDIYKLHFTTSLHLGDNREDYGVSLKTIQSDTLYASIISCLAKLGIDIPDNGDIGCNLTSLFPFYQEKTDTAPIYFFPKPLYQKLPNLENVANAKKIKNVRWLEKEYFEKVLNGHILFENNVEIKNIQDEYISAVKINSGFIDSNISPRVTVSRTGKEDAVPFYMDRIYFKGSSGLFFIVEGNTDLLERGLELLQFEGIGTDRNIGNGSFTFSKDTIDISLPDKTENSISMSVFIPENREQLKQMLEGDNVAYDFTRRGGWITTPPHNTLRKNSIYAFLPASVFSDNEKQPAIKGKIVDLAPVINFKPEINHPIWRNGRSIFLPIKI